MSHFHYDEEESNKRAFRKERKRASQQDRSKHKKSDRDKRERLTEERDEKRLKSKELQQGRVLSITPESIYVDVSGRIYLASLRGFVKKERQLASLLAPGDYVQIEPLEDNNARIFHIEKRKTALSRESKLKKGREKVLAANVDLVIIVASLRDPSLNLPFVDRTLIATLRGEMTPLILFNKVDLIEDRTLLNEWVKLYQQLLIKVLLTSTKTNEGIDQLKKEMQNKTSVFVGESGTGKSSLINTLFGLKRKIQDISEKTKKGVHTTTRAELIPFGDNSYCVDTPGIQVFGFVELTQKDLAFYFSDINALGKHCLFPDCTHTHEPHCNVQMALQKGELSRIRFDSYLSLLKEIRKNA